MAKKLAITLLAALVLAGAGAQAAGPIDLEAELGVFNKYVWRGMVVTPDAVVQPRASAGLFGFGLEFWGNVDTSDANEMEWRFNEINWTLTYGLGIGLVGLELGLIYYDIKIGDFPDTAELFLEGKVNVLLSPELTIYQDIDAYEGTYARAAVAYGKDISQTFAWELIGELGYGSDKYINSYFPYGNGSFASGLTDGFAGLSFPWHPVILMTVTPSVGWASLTGDARIPDGEDNDTVLYGLTVTASF